MSIGARAAAAEALSATAGGFAPGGAGGGGGGGSAPRGAGCGEAATFPVTTGGGGCADSKPVLSSRSVDPGEGAGEGSGGGGGGGASATFADSGAGISPAQAGSRTRASATQVRALVAVCMRSPGASPENDDTAETLHRSLHARGDFERRSDERRDLRRHRDVDRAHHALGVDQHHLDRLAVRLQRGGGRGAEPHDGGRARQH